MPQVPLAIVIAISTVVVAQLGYDLGISDRFSGYYAPVNQFRATLLREARDGDGRYLRVKAEGPNLHVIIDTTADFVYGDDLFYELGQYRLSTRPRCIRVIDNVLMALHVERNWYIEPGSINVIFEGYADARRGRPPYVYEGEYGDIDGVTYYDASSFSVREMRLDRRAPMSDVDVAFLRAYDFFRYIQSRRFMDAYVNRYSIDAYQQYREGPYYRKSQLIFEFVDYLAPRYDLLTTSSKILIRFLDWWEPDVPDPDLTRRPTHNPNAQRANPTIRPAAR